MNPIVQINHPIPNNTNTSTTDSQRNRFPRNGSSFACIMLYIVYLISFISFQAACTEAANSPFHSSSSLSVAAFLSGPQPTTTRQQQQQRPTFDVSATAFDSPPSSEMSDFQRRMRNLINSKSDKKKKSLQRNQNAPKNLMRIDTLEEYKHVISGNRDQLIVVRFYAPWCKACKAIAPAFYRLAITYPKTLFIDVPVTPDNANLHQGLGVTTLPFGHVYHPTGGLVEEIKMSKKHFARFAQVLKTYIDGKCEMDDYDELRTPTDGDTADDDSNEDVFR